jgi:Gram-negative bacterial TonB protein C-terminal
MSEISSHFVLPKQSFLSHWAEALPVLLSAASPIDTTKSGQLGKVLMESDARPSGLAFLASSLCHLSVVLLLIYVPSRLLFSARKSADDASLSQKQIIYYDLHAMRLEKTLPNLSSPGAGGKAGRGSHPKQTPSRGSDAFHPRLTMVMNPPKPDSVRQTIIQPASPPELKISEDLKLPNIMIGSVTPPRRPALPLRLQEPLAPARSDSEMQAPVVAEDSTRAPELLHSALPVLTSAPKLPVPALPMPAPNAEPAGQHGGGAAERGLPNVAISGSLLALGVNPGGLEGLLAVPPGNRYGAFSVSPYGGQPGSPGGTVGGDPQGGSSGATGAGDGSSSVGPESSGGGGRNNPGGTPALTVSGGTATFSGAAAIDFGNHTLPGVVAAGQIFPVLTPARVRGLNVQVFTGPTGGGGLGIYRVLPCDKIYTIALSMPSKNWVLQYCTRDPDNSNGPARTTNQVLHLTQGLVGPDPAAKFDFKRPPLPVEKRDKLIVLRGAIVEDGSVADVTVLAGADPAADTLAAAAFRQWKFQPALRSGKPVRVEVLVGVPAATP